MNIASPPPTEIGARYLLLLEAIIKDRGASPDLEDAAIGVARADGTDVWLCVKQGATVQTTYRDQLEQPYGLVMRVDHTDAEAILQEGALPDPPQLLEMRGHEDALEKFLATYLEQKDPLSMRVQSMKGGF